MSRPYISSFTIQYATQERIACEDLSPNVNVIYGSNEAGKSRVKDFLEWMLHAQSEELSLLKTAASKKAFSHLDSSLSGTAKIIVDNEPISVSQNLVDGITQTHINSSRISPRELSRLLTDGLSRDHYNNIFSLSLDELTRAESNRLITENELMNMFFGASINGSGISPPALLAELTKHKEELFSEAKQAKNKQINRVLKEISEINAQIKQLKQDENGIENIDAKIEDYGNTLTSLETELEELSKKITLSKEILNNVETFGRFEHLASEDKPEIHSDLITRMIDINMLVHTCKELIDQGDEREVLRLENSIKTLEAEQDSQNAELSSTVDPEKLGESARTPHFLSITEEEDRERIEHAEKIRSVKENVGNLSADLGLLSKEAEQLTLEIHKLDAEQNSSNSFESTDLIKKPRRKFSWGGSIAAIFGFAAAIFSFVSEQPIGAIIGVVLGIAAITYQLIPTTSGTPIDSSPAISHNDLLSQQLKRELESKSAKMTDLQERIEKLLNEQSQLDSSRELKKQKFLSAITDAGFPEESSPHLISLYINALKVYNARSQRIAELKSTLHGASTRLKALFERANNLKSLAKGTACEVAEEFKSVHEISAWANSLFDLSAEHKQIEENLHKRENEIRELEKSLTSSFSNIENAKEIYSEMDLNELELQYDVLQTRQQEVLSSKQEVEHEIIRLNLQRENASNSTAIADATQNSQRLIEELKSLHERYRSIFVAQNVVSNALENFLQANQPELLRVASSMMSKITRHQWNSITVAQSDSAKSTEPIVRVSGEKSEHGLAITQLSRGTREQLYLCLRLALMQTSTRGRSIPALFDDIAVNSDRSRFEALAPVIGEIGQTRQVVYFTCHETTRDILNRYAGAKVISI